MRTREDVGSCFEDPPLENERVRRVGPFSRTGDVDPVGRTDRLTSSWELEVWTFLRIPLLPPGYGREKFQCSDPDLKPGCPPSQSRVHEGPWWWFRSFPVVDLDVTCCVTTMTCGSSTDQV